MEERGFKVFVPEEEEPDKDSEVFFNDKMKKNRDLSAIALKVFRENAELDELRAVDSLAGSGIRGFRFSGSVDELHLNDLNPNAVESIEKGLEENSIEAEVHSEDANLLLTEHRNYFHFIDIDPFGSFAPFLDSTARAANHQSFVGLTATDNAVTAGSYKTTCRRRYGSEPLPEAFIHETGLRIYIREVFENFARYDKCFDPKLCFHERHYSRVMGRVTESKKRTNRTLENIGHLSFCRECLWRKLERKEVCENCGSETEVAGPLWTGKFVDQRFTGRMLERFPESWDESREFLELLDAGAEIITPYYDLHRLASNIGEAVPPRKEFLEQLESKGYPVSRTHFSPTGFRTDAPISDIKDVLRDTSRESDE
ncbi:MAG: tRNA (guanine(10)-N(2))-dimethyltransferase [Candidatus Nanohaloarchaea archaeon]